MNFPTGEKRDDVLSEVRDRGERKVREPEHKVERVTVFSHTYLHSLRHTHKEETRDATTHGFCSLSRGQRKARARRDKQPSETSSQEFAHSLSPIYTHIHSLRWRSYISVRAAVNGEIIGCSRLTLAPIWLPH